MRRIAGWFCFFMVCTACALAMSANKSDKPSFKADTVTIFLTGNTLGELKPCGCSGGQLGGFEKRAAILKGVPAEKQLLVDTGSLVKGSGEQDMIKLNISVQALDLLGYDVLNITEEDAKRAKDAGLMESLKELFSIISTDESAEAEKKFAKSFSIGEETVTVTVGAIKSGSGPIEQAVSTVFSDIAAGQAVNILIIDRCDKEILAEIGKTGLVDCIICPSESDEATIIGDSAGRPLTVTVGRLGKYVAKLEITPAKKASERPKIAFSPIPVTEDLAVEESLVELYKLYQQIVKDEGLLEKHPRFTLPDGLAYTGSQTCKICHGYEYDKWSTKRHADAFATLVKVGSQYDPECVVCHVIGMDYESGYVNEETTPHLKDVGCENCHGPGSEHIATAGRTKTSEPKSQCIQCHTPTHSAEYNGNEKEYFEKIIHWREPNAAGAVKNDESGK